MEQSPFKNTAWYHALTLPERLILFRANRQGFSETTIPVANRRIQLWRSQSPFSAGAYFSQRLAMDELTENEFFCLLGTPIDHFQRLVSALPDWLGGLEQAFAEAPGRDHKMPVPESCRNQKTYGFLGSISPLIEQGRHRVSVGLQAMSQHGEKVLFDHQKIEEILFTSLATRLLMMLSRTMILELNVARLKEELVGSTPEERFENFLKRLERPEISLALLQEYPVLARQSKICIDNWATSSLEVVQRLYDDWDSLRLILNAGEDLGTLIDLQVGLGDRHRRGQAVARAKFSSGLQVIYKPRPLTVDLRFQELLTWLNERDDHLPLKTIKIIDHGKYGWSEFVPVQSCKSPDEIRRFYERQGAYLALFYALEAADFHYENLIASGEYPIFVDLESLFHQSVIDLDKLDERFSDQRSSSIIINSVTRVGLLPQRLWVSQESDGIDVSGLGAISGQLSPRKMEQVENIGTDQMHITRKQMIMPGSNNRPTLNGTDVDILEYLDAILAGFTRMYRLLVKCKDELLSTDGPLAQFAGDETRAVVRPTITYGLLLSESFHPDMLRDALDRDRHFDRLWLGVVDRPRLNRLIVAECADLQQGDIPVFTTRPNSRDIWSSSNERIADFFDETSFERVRRRLHQLDEKDLERQQWFIQASFSTLGVKAMEENRAKGRQRRSGVPSPKTHATVDRRQLLDASCAIGDRLESLAIRGEQDVCWVGIGSLDGRNYLAMPLMADLYSGLAGVCLYLAYLGASTGTERYTRLAQAILPTIRRQVESSRSTTKAIGCYTGWGGLIYSLTHLGVLWDQPALLAEAEDIVELLPGLIEQDDQFDIMAGAAGCIKSLLCLYKYVPSARLLETAVQCGAILVSAARPMEHGVGWVVERMADRPLAGFSHGAAGIALALLELGAQTGDQRFRTLAVEAIVYERSLFSPEKGNWPNLRLYHSMESAEAGQNNDSAFMTAWCHGAPGVGLGRLNCIRFLNDEQIYAEIQIAIKTTLANGFGANQSLCHGDFGNLELILQAGEILSDPELQDRTYRLAARILAGVGKGGWKSGEPLNLEVPGLMTGLAGIGYGLLRLARPSSIPSILTLAPPLG